MLLCVGADASTSCFSYCFCYAVSGAWRPAMRFSVPGEDTWHQLISKQVALTRSIVASCLGDGLRNRDQPAITRPVRGREAPNEQHNTLPLDKPYRANTTSHTL